MALTPEGRVKLGIKKWLKAHDIWFTMPNVNGFGASGVPDFLCCWEGRFVAIEAKAKGKINNTTALQDDQIAAIKDAGGVAIVVDDVAQLDTHFKELGWI